MPSPDWVTRPAAQEEYEKLRNAKEKYGKYQLVMAPEREQIGTDLSGYEMERSQIIPLITLILISRFLTSPLN